MTLAALNGWYIAQCDGNWEHQGGLTIQTLDNPGWSIEVTFNGIEHHFIDGRLPLSHHTEDDDFLFAVYNAKAEQIRMSCSPNNLENMIAAFLAGVEGA